MTSRVFMPRTLLGLGVGVTAAALAFSAVAPADATVARSVALPTLSPGVAGGFVNLVQHTIAIRRTGVYDRTTVAMVKRVQAWKRVTPANGIVGPSTWRALFDPTMTTRMTVNSAARRTLTLAQFRGSVHGFGVVYRESKGVCRAVSRGGVYRGRWQMSAALWRANGGRAFAPTADRASCVQQDLVALRVWQRSWWRPWGG